MVCGQGGFVFRKNKEGEVAMVTDLARAAGRTFVGCVALLCSTGCSSFDSNELAAEVGDESAGEVREAVVVPETIAVNWTGKDAMQAYKGGRNDFETGSVESRWKAPNNPDGPWNNWSPFIPAIWTAFEISAARFANKAQLVAVHIPQNALLLKAQLDPDGSWTESTFSSPWPANVGTVHDIALVSDHPSNNGILLAIAASSGVWARRRDNVPPSASTTQWSSWTLVSSGEATEIAGIQRSDGVQALFWVRSSRLQAAKVRNTFPLSFDVDTQFGGTKSISRVATAKTRSWVPIVYAVLTDGSTIQSHDVDRAGSSWVSETGGGLGASEKIVSLAASNASNGREHLFAVTSAGRVLVKWYQSGRAWEPWAAF